MTPNFVIQIMMVLHILLEDMCKWKKKIVFSQYLSLIVHLLTKGFINWKCIHNQERWSSSHFTTAKVFFTSFKKITLKKRNTIFPMKNKYLCYHDPRCIISCGLMVYDIIMYHIKITQSSKIYKQGHDCVFTKMDTGMIYIYRGTLQYLDWKKRKLWVYWYSMWT